jgi:adenylate cyclase
MSGDTEHSNPNTPPVDRLSQLWRRINEHKIVQWSVAYVAVAYALQQGLVLMGGAFDWPDAVLRASMLLLILGLPVVITLAWYHGERASRHFSTAELSILSTLLVIGSLVFYLAVQPHAEVAADQAPPAQQTGVDKARAAAQSPATAISLAVLPFANMSGDASQEFFSDGITEEITSALVKIPDLRVVARTSAFEFKNQNRNVQSIGQQLNATHLIEGSVRKAGDRVRITVQLVKADDGTQIWSESYDRQLTDIFAIQEDIGRAIATSFNMRLGLAPGENLVSNRTVDVDLYQQFLRLRAQVRALNGQRTRAEVLPELEKLVARDPGFAPAWGYLSRLYVNIENTLDFTIWTRPAEETRRLWQPAYEKSEKAAREAIRLDPRQAFAHSMLALLESNGKRWAAAEDLHRKALELDPYDPDVLGSYATFLFQTGRTKDSLRVIQQARALEPLISGIAVNLAFALIADGQANAAIAVLDATPPVQGGGYAVAAQADAMAGRFDDAGEQLLKVNNSNAREAARLIRTAPGKTSDPSVLPAWNQAWDFVYAYIGASERLLDYPERAVQADQLHRINRLFTREYALVRNTERFKTLVRNMGLVDYWRAKGWPEFCRPTTGDDFECS